MSRNKSKNQYGSFIVAVSAYKKYWRHFVTAFVVVIFLLGGGLLGYNKFHNKKKIIAATVAVPDTQIPGWWYQQYFHSSVCEPTSSDWSACQPNADPDKDGLTNSQEYLYHSDPLNAHTAGNKLTDGQLVAEGYDPSKPNPTTFAQETTPDYISQDSLVVNQDINQIINQDIDPQNLTLPAIPNSELILTHDNSSQSVNNYLSATQNIFNKYFPSGFGTYIQNSIQSNDQASVSDIVQKSTQATLALEQIPVPNDFVQIQTYTLQLLQLLPQVIQVPSQDVISDVDNPQGNSWYQSAQEISVLYQKIDAESQVLQQKYSNAQ